MEEEKGKVPVALPLNIAQELGHHSGSLATLPRHRVFRQLKQLKQRQIPQKKKMPYFPA